MNSRWMLMAFSAAVVILSLTPAIPAQVPATRTIRIVTTSYQFEPNLITLRQGETAVLQLINADTVRTHSINMELLARLPVTVRGDIEAQETFGGRRFFAFALGKTIVEFVASERGTFSFICGISDHAARGQVGAINVLLPPSP